MKAYTGFGNALPAGLAARCFWEVRSLRMTEKEWMRPPSLRERQLALLIADGLTNREMAEKLGLSVYTVRNEVGRILQKLKAKNRSQIAYAVGRRS